MMVDKLKASDFKVTKVGACAIISSMLVLVALSAISLPIAQDCKAQDFSFSLSEEHVNVTVQKDGSVDINYFFSFLRYGSPPRSQADLQELRLNPGASTCFLLA